MGYIIPPSHKHTAISPYMQTILQLESPRSSVIDTIRHEHASNLVQVLGIVVSPC